MAQSCRSEPLRLWYMHIYTLEKEGIDGVELWK